MKSLQVSRPAPWSTRQIAVERYDYLIVGGGLAAAKCASTLRKLGADGSIGLISAENHPPYHRPPLSKGVLLGREDKESVFVYSPGFYEKKEIDLVLGARVASLDPATHTVVDERGNAHGYGKLLIATGSELRRLDIPGYGLEGVLYLRTLPDCLAILEKAGRTERAVVVGAGFIGMELASAFAQKGIRTTMLVRERQLFTKLGSTDLAGFFTGYYLDRGVNLLFGETAARFEGNGQVEAVVTSSGRSLPCDLAAVGVGVYPAVRFLEGAGLGIDNGILVDEYLRTNLPDVYAAGDVANFYDPIFEKRRRIEHWDNAMKQGELAARNMLGEMRPYDTVSYFFSDIFDLSFEFLGDNAEFDEVITRGAPESKSAAWLFLKGNRLVAGFLLGEAARDRKEVERIILAPTDLARYRESLNEPGFPLAEVL